MVNILGKKLKRSVYQLVLPTRSCIYYIIIQFIIVYNIGRKFIMFLNYVNDIEKFDVK